MRIFVAFVLFALAGTASAIDAVSCSQDTVSGAPVLVNVPGQPGVTANSYDIVPCLDGTLPAVNATQSNAFSVRVGDYLVPCNEAAEWSAAGLPAGVSLGGAYGDITGTVNTAGTYNATVTCDNGIAARDVALTINVSAASQIAAFPGAVGPGAEATGGRGGSVYIVTTTAASGVGSLQWALDQPSPKQIGFETGGVYGPVDLTLNTSDTTIFGQSATNPGVIINGTFRTPAAVDNLIVQNVTILAPAYPGAGGIGTGAGYDVLRASNSDTAIFDHVTLSGGVDETFEAFSGSNITFSNSMILNSRLTGHPEGQHNYGSITGPAASDILYHRNVIAHQRARCPSVSGGPVQISNNVMYNCRDVISNGGNTATGVHRYVSNYFIRGNDFGFMLPLFLDGSFGAGFDLYWSDNYVTDRNGQDGVLADPFAYSTFACGGSFTDPQCASLLAGADPGITYVYAPTVEASSNYQNWIDSAGAWPRVAYAVQVANDIANLTGAWGEEPTLPLDSGLPTEAAPADGDSDGLPDAWETANGLNIAVADSATLAPSGYSWFEVYNHEQLAAKIGALEAGAGPPVVDLQAPTNLSVTPGDQQLTVTWTNNSTGATGHEYQLDGGSWIAIANSASSTSYTITGLTNGVSYAVRIRAVADAVNGPDSAPASGIPTATGDAVARSFMYWTPAQLASAQAAEAAGWQRWEDTTAPISAYLPGGFANDEDANDATLNYPWNPQSRPAIMEDLLIHYLIDAGERANHLDIIREELVNIMAPGYDNWCCAEDFRTSPYVSQNFRDSWRSQGGTIARVLLWLHRHVDPNFWSASELATIRTRLDEVIGYWSTSALELFVGDDRWHGFPDGVRDSDNVVQNIAHLEVYLILGELGYLSPSVQSTLQATLDSATVAEHLDFFFDTDSGLFARGAQHESPSYMQNSPNYSRDLIRLRVDRGAYVPTGSETWGEEFALALALSKISVGDSNTYAGQWMYNDPVDPRDWTEPSRPAYGTRFRLHNIDRNAMWRLTPGTDIYRLFKYAEGQRSVASNTTEFETFLHFLNGDPSVTGSPPSSLSLPTHIVQGGTDQPMLLSRDSWAADGDQFMCYSFWDNSTDHYDGIPGHCELFDGGVPLFRYTASTRSGRYRIYNGLYYTTADQLLTVSGAGGSCPYGRCEAQEHNAPVHTINGIEHTASYSRYAIDGRKVWNYVNYGSSGSVTARDQYVLQNATGWLKLHEGDLVFQFVKSVTDPNVLITQGDTGSSTPYVRPQLRIQRTECTSLDSGGGVVDGEAFESGNFTVCDRWGRRLAIHPVFDQGGTHSFVSETNSTANTHLQNRGHLRTDWNGGAATSDLFTGLVMAYGDAGATLPTVEELTTDAGDVAAVRVTRAEDSLDVIVIQVRDPEAGFSAVAQVTSASAITASTRVYLLDADAGTLYTASFSGSQLTMTPGAGVAVTAGRVWEGTSN